MSTTIKIIMSTNKGASTMSIADIIDVPCKHNGGKVVIATVPDARLEDVCALLDDAHTVTSYDVRKPDAATAPTAEKLPRPENAEQWAAHFRKLASRNTQRGGDPEITTALRDAADMVEQHEMDEAERED